MAKAEQEVLKFFDPEATFKEQLGYIKTQKLKTYATCDIDLSVARSKAEYNIPGNNLCVVQLEGTVQIQLKEKDGPILTLVETP